MIAASDSPLWYCIKTRPRQEQAARKGLANDAGLEVFCPLLSFERVRRSGKARVTEAMFPGYLFARFEYVRNYRQVSTTNGVSHIVGFGGVPAVVSEGIIQELRSLVADKETVDIPAVIHPGAEVQVIEGPFRGIRALVTRVMPSQARVAVLLELLGMEREVEVGAGAVLPDIVHPLSQSAG